jgi:hypothetical protein
MSTCSKPIPFEMLVALSTGDLPPDEAATVEEHIFSCDDCAAASDRLARLVGGIRELIPPMLSHALRDRLVARGTRVLHTPVEASIPARARYAPDVDLLVHVLRADLSRADRVDVELVTPEGVALLQFEHVPFDAKGGEVLIACQRHYEGMFPDDPIFRLHAVEGGERRCVGDYFVHHEWR